MSDDLQNALSAIDGVDRSHVELSEHGPVAIRLALSPWADRLAVAEAVQRLLEARGLRSRVAPDRREPGPSRPPGPPAPGGPVSPPGPVPRSPEVILEADAPPAEPKPAGGVEMVTVAESIDGLVITVVADGGRIATRRALRSTPAMREAIVSAIGELVDPNLPLPGLRGVERSKDYPAMTVYLEDPAGSLKVGASLVMAGEAFAFARAVWSALHD